MGAILGTADQSQPRNIDDLAGTRVRIRRPRDGAFAAETQSVADVSRCQHARDTSVLLDLGRGVCRQFLRLAISGRLAPGAVPHDDAAVELDRGTPFRVADVSHS